MIELTPNEIIKAIGALHKGDGDAAGAHRAIIDSRDAGSGDLFFGLIGENADGGTYAPQVFAPGHGEWWSATITSTPPPLRRRTGSTYSVSAIHSRRLVPLRIAGETSSEYR